MIRLALSFDHELSLGGTDDYAANLFAPTDRLLDLARELAVPITLFTDVACAMRFREWAADRFFVPYQRQIARALSEGHDVQLHIHPHWFDSSFVGGRFRPSKSFALDDFARRAWPHNIEGIIKRGVAFLSELGTTASADYRCLAYRAGGFNLAPQTARIVLALLDNGILIDSSIAKGFYFESAISRVDFRTMPAEANWFIGTDGPLHVPAAAGLFEVPIASRPRTPLNNVPNLVKRVVYRRRAPAQSGRGVHEGNTTTAQKVARLAPRSAWMLSFDGYAESVSDQMRTLKHHVKHHDTSDEIICAAISHPKNMGEHSFGMLREFVNRVRRYYGRGVQFCSFRQIAEAHRLEGTLGQGTTRL